MTVLFCLDCREDLTPTPTNQLGFLYCALAQHQIAVREELHGLDRLDGLVDALLGKTAAISFRSEFEVSCGGLSS